MATAEICPVILAGGSGTRLWPLSRETFPKQLLKLHGEHTLLQETVLRLDGMAWPENAGEADVPIAAPTVVCNEEHRFPILDQLESIDRPPARILLEPLARNTAPAMSLAALAVEDADKDSVLLVMPADHVIRDQERFHAAVVSGFNYATDGLIVTFGIVPNAPETGYGYIETGAKLARGGNGCAVASFVEKPDAETAASYLARGGFLWNSGLFMVRSAVWLDAIARFQPEIATVCRQALHAGKQDGRFWRVDASIFSGCPSDSIDYAVMEHLTEEGAAGSNDHSHGLGAAVVPMDAGWSDVGSWAALLDINEADEGKNVRFGDTFASGTRNCLLMAEDRFVVALGLEDTVIVDTPDAVLVAHKDKSQDVKEVVEWLKRRGRHEAVSHRRTHRPWGHCEQTDSGEGFQVNRLTVNPGAVRPFQVCSHEAEHWVVVRGTARVTRDDEEYDLTENQSTLIPSGVRHRLENPGAVPLEIVAVQSGGRPRDGVGS